MNVCSRCGAKTENAGIECRKGCGATFFRCNAEKCGGDRGDTRRHEYHHAKKCTGSAVESPTGSGWKADPAKPKVPPALPPKIRKMPEAAPVAAPAALYTDEELDKWAAAIAKAEALADREVAKGKYAFPIVDLTKIPAAAIAAVRARLDPVDVQRGRDWEELKRATDAAKAAERIGNLLASKGKSAEADREWEKAIKLEQDAERIRARLYRE